jgi:N-acyl-L-homoserine lactone synthetase
VLQLINIISKETAGRHVGSLWQMHRLRKEVFNDRLGWSVAVSGDLEVDEYDALRAVYVLSETAGRVEGCVRLLPTLGPYMLRNTFASFLNDAEAPASANVWEASRFAVAYSSAKRESGLSVATYELLIGVLSFSLTHNIDAILCVLDVRMERVLRRAGWPMSRLCPARPIGSTLSLAGRLEVSVRVLQELRRRMAQQQETAVGVREFEFAADERAPLSVACRPRGALSRPSAPRRRETLVPV